MGLLLVSWKDIAEEVWEWLQAGWAQSYKTAISPSETQKYTSLHCLVC